MGKKVVILDYNLGNLFSVEHACDHVGLDSKISSSIDDLTAADAVILPGVGAFGEAMYNLKKLDLIEPLTDFVAAGKPLFGICLGLQLLFTESEEFGSTKGLGFIDGTIRRFPNEFNGNKMTVPQIAWNKIRQAKSWEGTSLESINNDEYFYFVHSYYVDPQNEEDKLTLTSYDGFEYCSAAHKNGNIFATQFHPEKSGKNGIEVYKTWAKHNKLI